MSPSALRSLAFLSRVLAINDLAWMSLAVLSVSTLDHIQGVSSNRRFFQQLLGGIFKF